MAGSSRYQTRVLNGACDDIGPALALRALAFRGGDPDTDSFDPLCDHIVLDRDGRAVCCFRLLTLPSGAATTGYSGQHYDLSCLANYNHPIVEMGRFCIHPDVRDPDLLRSAWGAMVRYIDARQAQMLIGCSSFAGIDASGYHDAFSILAEKHLAPRRWLPKAKAPNVFRFADRLRGKVADRKTALKRMPPLLKTYLTMGGWVSDHAVVDHDLHTLHVFTGLEIGAIPPARVKALRAGA